MLLHCERERGSSDDDAMLAAGWLRAGALDSLIELNELCLSLLAEQAAVGSGPASGLLQQLGGLWHRLDGASRHRAARDRFRLEGNRTRRLDNQVQKRNVYGEKHKRKPE